MAKFDCCKNCKPPKRSAGCHAICKEYLLDKAEKDAENLAVRRILDAENDFVGFKAKTSDAMRKRRFR